MTFSQIKPFMTWLVPTWDMTKGLSVVYQTKLSNIHCMMQKAAYQHLYLYRNGKTLKTGHKKHIYITHKVHLVVIHYSQHF